MADFNVDELPDLNSNFNVDDLPSLVKSPQVKTTSTTQATQPQTQVAPQEPSFSGVMNRQKTAQIPKANFPEPVKPKEVPRETVSQEMPQEKYSIGVRVEDISAPQMQYPAGMGAKIEYAKQQQKPTAKDIVGKLSADELINTNNQGIESRILAVNPKTTEQLDFEKKSLEQNNLNAYQKEMGTYQMRADALKTKMQPLKEILELQYGKDFEDTIGDKIEGYNAQYQALKAKIDPIEAQLIQKYGADFQNKITQDDFNADAQIQQYFKIGGEINKVAEEAQKIQAKYEGDADLQNYLKMRKGLFDISQEASALINDPRFAETKGVFAEAKFSQAQKDALKKEYQQKGALGKAADIAAGLFEFSGVPAVVRSLGGWTPKTFTGTKLLDESDKFMGRALTWLASIPKMTERLNPFGEPMQYDFLDKWYDQAAEYSEKKKLTKPTATDVQRDIIQKFAKVDDYQVYLDDNNNATVVKDAKGFEVSDAEAQKIKEKYKQDPAKYKVEKDFDVATLVTTATPTILDMSALIGISAVTGGGTVAFIPSVAAQTYSDIYQNAVKKGLDPEKANDMATITSMMIGMIGLVNPLESRIAQGTMGKTFGKIFGNQLTKADVQLINSGKLSVKDITKRLAISGLKNSGLELSEEMLLEPLAQRIEEYAYNKEAQKYGVGFDVNAPLMSKKEAIETAMITTMTSMLMTPVEVAGSIPEQRRQALKRSLDMPEKYMQYKQEAFDKGLISEDEYNYDATVFNSVLKKYNASKDIIDEDLHDELSELLLKKYTLEKKIGEVNDKALNVKNQELLDDVNKKLEQMARGEYKSQVVTPTTAVSEGTGMMGKEASDVANKLINNEQLTSGERDIYDAFKTEIDKIVESARGTQKEVTTTAEVLPSKVTETPQPEVAPKVEEVAPTEVKTPQYEEEARKAEEPLLEGVRDGGREAEAGQVGPELRTEAEEKAVAPTEGVTTTLPPSTKKGTERTMVFKDGEWQERRGKTTTKVGKKVQDQAQEAFMAQELPKTLEIPAENAEYNTAQEVNNNIATKNPEASVLVLPTEGGLSVNAIFVKKENRNKGIGKKVLDTIKEEADRTGKTMFVEATTELDKETDIERLNKFYENNGFTKVGKNKFKYDPAKKAPQVVPTEETTTIVKQPQKTEPEALSSVEETARALEGVDIAGLAQNIPSPKNPKGLPLKKMDKTDFQNWVGNENVVKGKIKVYRGSSFGGLRTGDFVTTNKEYAKKYGKNIKEYEIPISELNYFSGVKGGNPDLVGTQLGGSQPTELIYTGEPNFTPQEISEAYHKAKADGSNPELIKAVEDLLGKPTEPAQTDIETTKPAPEKPTEVNPTVQQASDLYSQMKEAKTLKEKRNLAEQRKKLMEDNPTLKYIDDNIKKIYRQLEKEGIIKLEGDCL